MLLLPRAVVVLSKPPKHLDLTQIEAIVTEIEREKEAGAFWFSVLFR